jgi:hypothetical protein
LRLGANTTNAGKCRHIWRPPVLMMLYVHLSFLKAAQENNCRIGENSPNVVTRPLSNSDPRPVL